jgi:hypothetical protein
MCIRLGRPDSDATSRGVRVGYCIWTPGRVRRARKPAAARAAAAKVRGDGLGPMDEGRGSRSARRRGAGRCASELWRAAASAGRPGAAGSDSDRDRQLPGTPLALPAGGVTSHAATFYDCTLIPVWAGWLRLVGTSCGPDREASLIAPRHPWSTTAHGYRPRSESGRPCAGRAGCGHRSGHGHSGPGPSAQDSERSMVPRNTCERST